jgi:mannosyl-oligosaccharide alpha-1,2-mannosidase
MNFLGNNVAAKTSSSLRRRGISIRHIAFAFASSIILLTLYFNYFRRTSYLFPADVIHYASETPEVWTV